MSRHRHLLLAGASLAGCLAAAATAGAVPTITTDDPDRIFGAGQTPTFTITAGPGQRFVNYQLDEDITTYRQRQLSPVTVRFPDLPEGPHLLSAADTDERPIVIQTLAFTVDRTPPAIAVTVPAEGASVARDERVVAAYECTDAVRCEGPVASGQPLDTSTPGTRTFTVTATDAAGNPATLVRSYTVRPEAPVTAGAPPENPPAAPPVVRPRRGADRPATVNPRALRPAAGARFPALRPTLRWRPHRGALLYNVQVFVLEGAAPRKVLSAFPRRTYLKIPARRLQPGRRYVWRVWPFLGRGRGFTPRPLGISFFDVRARPAAPAPASR